MARRPRRVARKGRQRHAVHPLMPDGLAFPVPEVVADLGDALWSARSVPAHG